MLRPKELARIGFRHGPRRFFMMFRGPQALNDRLLKPRLLLALPGVCLYGIGTSSREAGGVEQRSGRHCSESRFLGSLEFWS